MLMGALTATCFMEGNRSLKDKRRVVKSLLARVKARFNVSAAEVGHLDSRDHAQVGFTVCGTDAKILAGVLDRLLNFVENNVDAELVSSDLAFPISFDDFTDDVPLDEFLSDDELLLGEGSGEE
jgi:uncharacterized protein YlxP (DUF503 family)